MYAHVNSAFRSLRRKPAFLALAALALGAGTGATITLFSLVHAVFLQPLPYPDADRLVWVRERHADIPARPVSYPNFRDWQARNETFEAMAAVRNARRTLTGLGEARTLDVAIVTADYFRVIGVPPELGRNFAESEDVFTAAPVVVVSHQLWQDALGADVDQIGGDLTLDGMGHSVVGVPRRI